MQVALQQQSLIRKIQGAMFGGAAPRHCKSCLRQYCQEPFFFFSFLFSLFVLFLLFDCFLSLLLIYLQDSLQYIYSIFLSLFYHCYSSLNQPRRTPSLHSPTNHPPPPQTLNGNALFLSFLPVCQQNLFLSSPTTTSTTTTTTSSLSTSPSRLLRLYDTFVFFSIDIVVAFLVMF